MCAVMARSSRGSQLTVAAFEVASDVTVTLMETPDFDAAVALAREAIGVTGIAPAITRSVRRLDCDGRYVLVHLGASGQPGWIAAVDVDSKSVMSWVSNPQGRSSL
jgi:hypothetical protein